MCCDFELKSTLFMESIFELGVGLFTGGFELE